MTFQTQTIVIGGGISGLSAASRLQSCGVNVLLIESRDQVGGVIQSSETDGYLIERGPNSLRGTQDLLDLMGEYSLTDDCQAANPEAPAYVLADDRLQAVPMGLGPLVKTRLLSTHAKLRLLREPFTKQRQDNSEESVASFIERRLGSELLQNLVNPFVSGIYAGDVNRLSIQASFPKLAEYEALGGSILRGAIKASRSGGPKRNPALRRLRMCSFRRGLQTLPLALGARLGRNAMMGARVTSVQRVDEGRRYEVRVEQKGETKTIFADDVIVATPAFVAADLLAGISSELSALLCAIPYAGIASVPMGYRTEDVGVPLSGFGFLIPRGAGYRSLGTVWNSSLFAGRAPEGRLLVTTYVGGATDPEAVNLPDDELAKIVHGELASILEIDGVPHRLPITRWVRGLPQYELGHAERLKQIASSLEKLEGLHLVGNYLGGISLGDCISQGIKVANEICAG